MAAVNAEMLERVLLEMHDRADIFDPEFMKKELARISLDEDFYPMVRSNIERALPMIGMMLGSVPSDMLPALLQSVFEAFWTEGLVAGALYAQRRLEHESSGAV